MSTFVMYTLPLTKGLRTTFYCIFLKTNILVEKYVEEKDSRIVYILIYSSQKPIGKGVDDGYYIGYS